VTRQHWKFLKACDLWHRVAPGSAPSKSLIPRAASLRRQSLYPAELRARSTSAKCTSRGLPHQWGGL